MNNRVHFTCSDGRRVQLLSCILLVTVLALGLVFGIACTTDQKEPSQTAESRGDEGGEVTNPGSPSATTTIAGKQLPPPPDKKFGGTIEPNAIDSTPYWPPRVVPPKGAPNILLIMTDDAGYGVSSTFGGVIPTPSMGRIAEDGLRFTHFHSTSVCSPTRAALLTGRNHHQMGTGSIPELSTG